MGDTDGILCTLPATSALSIPTNSNVTTALSVIGSKLALIMADMANMTVTVKSSKGNAIPNIPITGLVDSSGNIVRTGSNGVAVGLIAAGSSTLSVTGYADIVDFSKTYTISRGGTYSDSITLTTNNFIKCEVSTNIKFSKNVSALDCSLVGGGAGGGASPNANYGGGGGGFCTVQTSVPFVPEQTYPVVIGGGGACGTTTNGQGDGNTAKAGGNTTAMSLSANGGGIYKQSANGAGGRNAYYSVSYDGVISSSNGLSGGTGSGSYYTSYTEVARCGGGGGGGGVNRQGANSGGNGGYPNGGNGGSWNDTLTGTTRSPEPGRTPGGGGAGALARMNNQGNGQNGGNGIATFRMHLSIS